MNRQLNELRKIMEQEGIDFYLIPTEDWHGSEYVGDYFKCREYITGFTGSAGTALVWAEGAGLWTDGRYFIQAEEQLKDSGFTLYRMGTEGTPSIAEFIENKIEKDQVLGVDGRTISREYAEKLVGIVKKKGAIFKERDDLFDKIWQERPQRSSEGIWFPDETYCGDTREEKIAGVRKILLDQHMDMLVLSALDEISWLFNIRGGDIACCPMPLSFAVVGRERIILYLQGEAMDERVFSLADKGIEIHSYQRIFQELSDLTRDQAVWADKTTLNQALWKMLGHAAEIKSDPSPIIKLKAVKSAGEQEGFRKAHLYDGAAVTRFQFWLKAHIHDEKITEISAAAKLEEFRKQYAGYLMPSFDPIVASGDHGAIVHYSATKETDRVLTENGFVLMDTGGHYKEGTTDITRTIPLGSLSDRQKEDYTRVLMGNLRLADAKFLYGCTGENLDAIARMPLWQAGLDYKHGTGHGVGWLTNVHEGPQGIRWRYINGRNPIVLEPGMILSNEPGVYIEGEYGIRLENLLLCVEGERSRGDRFLQWEVLTLVPFEREAVKVELLTEEDRMLLNRYHEQVREKLLPFMESESEQYALLSATEKI